MSPRDADGRRGTQVWMGGPIPATRDEAEQAERAEQAEQVDEAGAKTKRERTSSKRWEPVSAQPTEAAPAPPAAPAQAPQMSSGPGRGGWVRVDHSVPTPLASKPASPRPKAPSGKSPGTWGPVPEHLDPRALPNSTHRIGERIGDRYHLERFLGHGRLTETWAALHVDLDRPVAIKFLHPKQLGAGGGERLLEEARSVARIRHPHVVEFSDSGRTVGGEPFLVMELLEGMPLSTVLAARGSMPWARAVNVAKQVAAALSAAHQQGVIHRDLRPANVFCVDTDEVGDFVKVVDFGLARRGPTDDPNADTPGESVAYMSPEQCRGGVLTPRSDVYALGCLIFAMITGDPPFPFTGDAAAVRRRHESEMPKFLSERAPRQFISEELEAVVARCLAKDPSHRFADTVELGAELGRIAQSAAAASIAGAPVIREEPSAGDSVSLPMKFSRRDLSEVAAKATAAKPKEPAKASEQAREPVAPAKPNKKSGGFVRTAAAAIGVAILVGGAGIGMYLLVSRLIEDVEQPASAGPSADPSGAASQPDAAEAKPSPGAEAGAEAAEAAPSEPAAAEPAPEEPAAAETGGAPQQDEAPAKAAPAKAKKSAASKSEAKDAPAEAKPSTAPDSKAKGAIGHEDLEDPWG